MSRVLNVLVQDLLKANYKNNGTMCDVIHALYAQNKTEIDMNNDVQYTLNDVEHKAFNISKTGSILKVMYGSMHPIVDPMVEPNIAYEFNSSETGPCTIICTAHNNILTKYSIIDDVILHDYKEDSFSPHDALKIITPADIINQICNYIVNSDMFTSKDLCNDLKLSKLAWIRNRDVTNILRRSEFIEKIMTSAQYNTSLITCYKEDDTEILTQLYHLDGTNEYQYIDKRRRKKDLTPDDVAEYDVLSKIVVKEHNKGLGRANLLNPGNNVYIAFFV